MPDTVALSEPFNAESLAVKMSRDPQRACVQIRSLVGEMRECILSEGRAPSVQVEGRLYDNIVASRPADSGLRERRGEWGLITIGKSLSSQFTLVIRKNALFTALLPHLTDFFPCVVVVRNPLATLASWQTVDLPVHRGRVPGAEPYDRDLRRILDQEPERLRRQVTVLNWFFGRYRAHLDLRHVIRYEDLIESGGSVLFRLLGRDDAESVALESRNDNALYRGVSAQTLLQALLETGGAWTHYYRPRDLEHAAAGIGRQV